MIDKPVKAGEWFEPHLAFPNGIHTGMTLRDYFAAQALQGLLADSKTNMFIEEVVQIAYEYSNAMLEERKK